MSMQANDRGRSRRDLPVVTSRLDTDIYKFFGTQVTYKEGMLAGRPEGMDVQVTMGLTNRTTGVRLAEELDMGEVRENLEHVRSLPFRRHEISHLAGETFQGAVGIFTPEFLSWLVNGHRLPEVHVEATTDGQLRVESTGSFKDVKNWEIHVLSIVNELRHRKALRSMGMFSADVAYAKATVGLDRKLSLLSGVDGLSVSEFGTRRRHSRAWQEYCVTAMKESMGGAFLGTSNVLLAMEHDLEAIGTTAHEESMVRAALADTDEALVASQYETLLAWQRTYGDNIRVFLPDAYGTEQFLRNAPEWVADWTGMREDSMDAVQSAGLYTAFLRRWGRDTRSRRFIYADGLDAEDMLRIQGALGDKFRLGFGWGTNLTNDFKAAGVPGLRPISLVFKPISVNGRATVKLSNNPAKASGPAAEVARYRRAFNLTEDRQQRVELEV